MGMQKKTALVTIMASRESVPSVLEALSGAGLSYVNSSAARKIQLRENQGFFRFVSGSKSLSDVPLTLFSFLVDADSEKALLQHVIEHASLDVPGRGSVFSREMFLLAAHESCPENRVRGLDVTPRNLLPELMGITCIVQKGEGNRVGRVGLDTGSGVPAVTYGEGTGLRDKLGLWRITIPAEKEIVSLVATPHDAANVFELMIDVGRLDQPGRGFIFQYPVARGLIDTRSHIGFSSQAASVEQIIAALDGLKGGTEWRRRELVLQAPGSGGRPYLQDLVNLTLVCNEGHGQDLIMAAMKAGAPGATISKIKHVAFSGSQSGPVLAAREKAEMIVPAKQVAPVTDALVAAGAVSDNACGQIYHGSVPKACTYMGKPG